MKRILFFLTAIAVISCQPSDKELWEKAKNTHTKKGYELYLSQTEEGQYSDSAKLLIEGLTWEEVVNRNTKDSYQKYLNEYQNEGRFTMQANWNIALIENKVGSYENFLENFPNSDYEKAAIDSILRSPFQWLKKTDNPVFVQNISFSNNNKIAIVGSSGNLNKPWIKIIDHSGTILYEKTSSQPNSSSQYRDVVTLPNGNFMAGGYVSGTTNNGIWVSGIDTSGNNLWNEFHNKLTAGIILDMEFMSDNNVIAVGEFSGTNPENSYSNDYERAKNSFRSALGFLVHKNAIKHAQMVKASSENLNGFVANFNNKGELLWHKSINKGMLTYLNKALATSDSCIVVAGTANKSTMFFQKFDTEGQLLWKQTFANLGNVSEMIELENGEIMVAAYKHLHPFDNVVLIRLSPKSGEIIENKPFKEESHYATAMLPTQNEGFIIAGKKVLPDNSESIWIAKFKKNGDLHWEKNIPVTFDFEKLKLIKTSDNDFFLSGTIKKLYASKGSFVMKL